MIINSKLYSFPPIGQYYDVVGTVTVNSLSKLQEYKRDVENEIYKCPSCGANLKYEAANSGLKCDYCGYELSSSQNVLKQQMLI